MSQHRLARISLLLAAIGLNVAPALVGVVSPAYAQKGGVPAGGGGKTLGAEKDAKKDPNAPADAPKDSVRPEIFKLVDPAVIKELMAAKNYTEVQSRIDQGAALPNLNPYEVFVLNRMRLSLGSATGNDAMSMAALEAVVDSSFLPAANRGDFLFVLGNHYFNAKNYPKAIETYTRYQTETGDTAKVRNSIIRAYYFSNDYDKAKQELLIDIQAAEKAGTVPALEQLQMLGNIGATTGNKSKDYATYLTALEKLVRYYPNDDYWTDLLSRTQGKQGYSEHLRIDVLRLQRAAVKSMAAEDYVDLAELALQAGFPTEAKHAMDAGYAAGVLGKGTDVARHKKLRDQANKGAADDLKNIAGGEASANKSKDGAGLVNLGYAYATMGQYDKGIELIQKGIAKGGLKRPEDAKLRLGEAYALADRKDDALATFATVKGNEGLGDLARYWSYLLNRKDAPAASAAK